MEVVGYDNSPSLRLLTVRLYSFCMKKKQGSGDAMIAVATASASQVFLTHIRKVFARNTRLYQIL